MDESRTGTLVWQCLRILQTGALVKRRHNRRTHNQEQAKLPSARRLEFGKGLPSVIWQPPQLVLG